MELTKKIETILETPLKEKGYDIVHILLSGRVKSVLQIMIERIDGLPVTITDCSIASRVASFYLDQADPIERNYTLEMSSPGFDRPLVKTRDFQRFCGHNVKVHTFLPFNNRKRFNGELVDANNERITLRCETETGECLFSFHYDQIKSARLSVKL